MKCINIDSLTFVEEKKEKSSLMLTLDMKTHQVHLLEKPVMKTRKSTKLKKIKQISSNKIFHFSSPLYKLLVN